MMIKDLVIAVQMKYVVFFRIIFPNHDGSLCLYFPGAFSAHSQPKQVDAVAGEKTILPCTFKTPTDKDIPTVEWSKEVEDQKPAIVFLYRDGCETFEMKDPDFEYRTHLFMRELQNGNYSLRISDVRLSDAGMYQCMIIQKNGTKKHTRVHLVVGMFLCYYITITRIFLQYAKHFLSWTLDSNSAQKKKKWQNW